MELITNRTASDLARVRQLVEEGMTEEQRAEWNAGIIGAYNADDLNRVGRAVEYLTEVLAENGYIVHTAAKTDWTSGDYPTAEKMADYIANIRALRTRFAMMATTPAVPDDMDRLTYDEANAIEKILLDLEQLLENMIAAWIYSGEVYSGEV